MNAREELLAHVGDREVEYVSVGYRDKVIRGTMSEVLPRLDFDYDPVWGKQELFGFIWYTDGAWSEREKQHGVEYWECRVRPPMPQCVKFETSQSENKA